MAHENAADSYFPSGARRLGVTTWVALVVVYLVVVQGVAQLLTRGLDVEYAAPTDVDELWRMITVPTGTSLVLIVAVVSYLRWWRPVSVDDRPVQPWVIVVPAVMVVSVLIVTNYPGLADKGMGFTLLLLVSALFVGFGEELMFRGLGVTTFRSNGFTEGKAALWSTVVFGLAHATNLITEGLGAIPQVFATIIAGYFLYLIRRRSGGILVPAVLHGLWDFSLISNQVDPDGFRAVVGVPILVMVFLAVLLLLRRHRIEVVQPRVTA